MVCRHMATLCGRMLSLLHFHTSILVKMDVVFLRINETNQIHRIFVLDSLLSYEQWTKH